MHKAFFEHSEVSILGKNKKPVLATAVAHISAICIFN